MNMIEIPEAGKKVVYPASWGECNRSQIRFIFRQALQLIGGNIGMTEFKIRVLYFLAGMKREKRHERKERMLTGEQLARKYLNVVMAADTIDFMFREQKGQQLFEYNRVGNVIPVIRGGMKRVYGPSEALFNITFGEYMVAFDFFRHYVEHKDENSLNKLCAVLYRPKRRGKIDNDIRVEFNANESVRRAKWWRRVSLVDRFIIYSWFAACDNFFKTGDIEVDGNRISFRGLFKQAGGDELGEKDIGLTGVLMSVAESGTFGTLEDVNRTNLYTVLLKLYHWHLEHKRIEQKSKKDGKTE
ncbi:hypothetical protein [uncultured Butyricimonas sp.]|uniref:hypothetical protein n=1 Tax=uncultured Butyricimonas sp. TaxID=1268785 RepID=UPI0026DBF1B5|nr:hypothetical protein [uncultured Butyricimonas sp.]